MGVPTQNGIQSGDTGCELDVRVCTVVGKKDDDLGTLSSHCIHFCLQLALLDPEGPPLGQVTRISDGGIRKRLTDDRYRHTVHFPHRMPWKNRVTKIEVFHVMR